MPQRHRAKATNEPEMMDMDEPVAPEPIEPPVEPAIEPDAANEEEEEYKETITIRALDLLALQHSFDDMRFRIANIERGARQAQLEAEERFEAQQSLLRPILDKLPPAP
jgi:hypothetical protein